MTKAKKAIMIMLASVALLSSAFAAQSMNVTWTWNHDDPNVNYYRYQVNAEGDDGWVVVSGTTLSYELTDLDPYSSYTLYLQCSYDGENWSETAEAVAEPLLVAEEPAPVVEEVVTETVVEEVVEEPVAEPEVKEETPVVETTPVVEEKPVVKSEKKSDYGYKTNLLLSAGASTNVTFDSFKLDGAFPRFNLALDLQNIVHAGPWGMGLRFDFGAILEPVAQDWNNFDMKNFKIWTDSSVDAMLMMYLGNNSFDFYLGGGAGYSLFNPKLAGELTQVKYGHSLGNFGVFSSGWFAAANVGMRVRFNSVFSMGVEANYRYLLPAKAHTASADLVFGFTF